MCLKASELPKCFQMLNQRTKLPSREEKTGCFRSAEAGQNDASCGKLVPKEKETEGHARLSRPISLPNPQVRSGHSLAELG